MMARRLLRVAAVAAVLAAGGMAGAETLKLPITADVGICAAKAEQENNTGGKSTIRVKGNEHYYLFTFERKAAGEVVSAALHVKLARGELRRVAFCTVPVEWTEGKATDAPQDGAADFLHARHGRSAWTPWGGTMLDATFNNPAMRWAASDVKAAADKWLEIPIEPALVQAVLAGYSYGLVMSDEKGQTFENHDIYAREQSASAPYLMVQTRPLQPATQPARPLAARADAAHAGFNAGAISVDTSWKEGGQALQATRVRLYADAAQFDAGKPLAEAVTLAEPLVVFEGLKPSATYLVRASSLCGGAEVASAVHKATASAALAVPAAPELKPPQSTPRIFESAGWRIELRRLSEVVAPDAAAGKLDAAWPVPLALRNANLALQVVLYPPGGEAANISIELPTLAFAGPQARTVPPLTNVRLYRAWHAIDAKAIPQADALVPLKLGDGFDIPWKLNKLPRQTNQSLVLDVYVPAAAAVGPYSGELRVVQAGKTVASAAIALEVSAAALSDTYSIVGGCNTYGSPARGLAKGADAKAIAAAEGKYYRLAHEHRCTLNALHYSHAGEVDAGCAPTVTARDGKLQFDWKRWDERFGPLLTGEAFSRAAGYVGPGEGRPVDHMYLPIHENWPATLAEHFTPWPPPKDFQQFLAWTTRLGKLDDRFDAGYRDAWRDVVNAFELHAKELGSTTRLQVYLNNKMMYRDPKNGGRGITLWTLDEPAFADDFAALAFFGRLYRSSYVHPLGWAHRQLEFRIDISRPTHQRNWLDGVVDLNVVPDQLYSQRRLIAQRRSTFGERYWDYHMPPSFGPDRAGWASWAVRAYAWGAVGTLPWQTVGNDGDLDKLDATALIYPPARFGADAPLPSLRLKAWREGLQDAELLRQLRSEQKWNDAQLRAFIGQVCGLDGWRDGDNPPADSPIATFSGLSAGRAEALRRTAAALLPAQRMQKDSVQTPTDK
jgi:hypothetical protein